ncbi:Myo-inositol transporter 1 [Colletotrichum sp. SAR 10_98]|nr:Myo-inositol transporter 1 [Colletotrichum sp. SAR 10_98]
MGVVNKDDEAPSPGVQHIEQDAAVADAIKAVEHRDLERIEETQPGAFVWLCAAATAIGGMLFGYDTGVISGVLVVIGTDLGGKELTHSEKELVTALTAAGALLGAIFAGLTADKLGRKPSIWFASVLFTLGAVIQSASFSVAQMAVGRLVIGLGVGSASMMVPLYIAEISPARFRGRMISVDMIFLGSGSVLAYAFDAAFYKTPHGWRYMIAIGGIPSIVLGILLFWCPESPRQLMFHGKREECVRVLRRIYPNAIAAIAFHWIPLDLNTLELKTQEVGWPAILVLVSMIMFVAFYAAGLGCVPWQANEFLPMEVRASGTMMINIFNWGPNIIVSSTFLSMMRGMTPSGTFGFYAGLSFLGWVFVIFCFPEAANMTLEEIRIVFEHGFGVRYAEEWRKQRKLDLQTRREEANV